MESLKKYKVVITVILAAVLPYLAYKYAAPALGLRDDNKVLLDSEVPGLYITVDSSGVSVTYQNGKKAKIEAFGVAVVTKTDNDKVPDRLKSVSTIQAADFPVVVLFNASGFDGTGDPTEVFRAADGSLVWSDIKRARPVRLAVVRRDGTFAAHYFDGTSGTVDEKEWYSRYMGVEEVPILPAPEELDKMTPEQLKALGIDRMTREEYKEKFGKYPDDNKVDPKEPAPKDQVPNPPVLKEPSKDLPPKDQATAGLRGRVIVVGGPKAAVRGIKVTIAVYAGKLNSKEKLPTALALGETAEDGSYAIGLSPGTYTLLVKGTDGKWRGNAIDPTSWPSVDVKTAWVDYDFRLPSSK